MRVQFRLTQEIKNTFVDDLDLHGKALNYLHRKGIYQIKDLVDNWYNIGGEKGIGVGTVSAIRNAMINLMIQKLPKDELIEWFKFLIENNEPEDLRGIIEDFEKVTDEAVA